MTEKPDPFTVPFGTIFCDWMTTARADDGPYVYGGVAEPFGDFSISPAAHVLHYGSAIFEGLKAHRQVDGSLAIFRLDSHVARMVASAETAAAASHRRRRLASDVHRRCRGERR